MEKILWHTLDKKDVFSELNAEKNGLSADQAEQRLAKHGLNRLPEEKPLSRTMTFISQFKSPLVYVLLVAAAISLYLQDYIDMSVIMVAVGLNAVLGFYQESKANRAITYLKKLVEHKAKVIRDGNEIMIRADRLVPGDIIFLSAGDKIAADCRLIKVDNFQVNEASLTGESVPSTKNLEVLEPGVPLADRKNMIFSGTVVSRGKAEAVVCETGINTQLGQITQLVKETSEEKTPLQKQLAVFSRALTYVVIFASFMIILIGKIGGRPIFGFGDAGRESLLNTAAAVAVAAIPEGLLISVTAILAIGMQRILKHKALVRRLIAAETLGSVSVICADKTGTLTEGKMQVAKIITDAGELPISDGRYEEGGQLKDHELVLKISLLCNNAVIENPDDELSRWKIIGDPTETALLLAAIESGIPYQGINKRQSRIAEIPFDGEIKYMATRNKLNRDKNVIYVKGAPERVLAMADQVRINGKKEKLDERRLKSLKNKYEALTSQGLRLLAFAYKQTPAGDKTPLADQLSELIFIGFIALKDPLRPEAKNTINLARQAGIRPIVITGDHRLTAKAIVSELGIKIEEKNILTGEELDKLSDEKLLKKIRDVDIYARVEPRHKLRIVKLWQGLGEVVAMTGDGVNDAPALKAADVGIALGSGTDVAKETSDIVLLDNNFKTIVAAVEQGRVIYDNIKKVLLYLLTDSFSEIVLISGSLLLNLPLPILASQIIWVNLVDDGIPNLALTMEPGEKDIMKARPRKKNEKIFDIEMKTVLFSVGLIYNTIMMGLFFYLVKFTEADINYIRTLIFTVLGVDSLIYIFSCRSLKHSIFYQNPFSNPYLIVAVLIGFILQLAAVYLPQLQVVFKTVNLGLYDWLLIFSLTGLQVTIIELTKRFFFTKQKTVAA